MLSGEGPTDLGHCSNQQNNCSIPELSVGPMTVIADQVIESQYKYSLLSDTPDSYRYFSKQALEQREAIRKNEKRCVSFRGKKRDEETAYFYINAWMLGDIAREIESEEEDETIAILFRDSDGTNSSPSDLWQRKANSMLSGFARAEFLRGVPMLPRPKSEAWLLCAAKSEPYQFCAALENLPGNDESPNAAKSKLDSVFQGNTSSSQLVAWLSNLPFDHLKVSEEMESFNHFRTWLLKVLP